MESEDYPFFQGLVFLLENDVSSLGYELTFSTEVCISSLNISFSFNCNIVRFGYYKSLVRFDVPSE